MSLPVYAAYRNVAFSEYLFPPLVTGASNGVGLACAKALVGGGASVVMACRAGEKAEAAKAAAEEEERLRKEAEEAAAAEAAAAEKKEPQNVDEAVDFSAEKRVEEVKKELSALYKAREEELLAKIAALEAKLGG